MKLSGHESDKSLNGKPCRRILIVEDHPMMRRAVAAVIEHEPDLTVCGEAADTMTAMEIARRTQPDLAIVDLRLDAGHGLELLPHLRAQHPELKCLVYSSLDEKLYGERAVNAGAAGFLSKRAPSSHIVEAIRAILDGHIYLNPDVASQMLRHRQGKGEATSTSAIESLSDREIAVFELFGEGKSLSQVAEQLAISPKTVDSHRQRIKRKLNVNSNAELMRLAVEWFTMR